MRDLVEAVAQHLRPDADGLEQDVVARVSPLHSAGSLAYRCSGDQRTGCSRGCRSRRSRPRAGPEPATAPPASAMMRVAHRGGREPMTFGFEYQERTARSKVLFDEASSLIPGGAGSSARTV